MIEIRKKLDDTWNEIMASTDNIRYFKGQIREMEEAIGEYQEKRKNLGSYRDYLSKKLDEMIAKQVADREKSEVENFELVFQKFLNDVKVWRETVDNYFHLQINTGSNERDESLGSDQTPTRSEKSSMIMAWQIDRDRAEAGTSSTFQGEGSSKKRNMSSQTVWKPRMKPYKIPRLNSQSKNSLSERMSEFTVIRDPAVVQDPIISESSNSSDDCVITGQYKIAEETVKIAVEKAVEAANAMKENVRERVEENVELAVNIPPAGGAEGGSTPPKAMSIAELGLQNAQGNRVSDIAGGLLERRSGPFEIIESFPREILIKIAMDPTKPHRLHKVHLSARCSFNWIGETAVRDLLNPNTEAGVVNELRREDWINHEWNCIRDIRYWVKPEMSIGGIVFRRKFFVVPKKHTMFFAPMRIQLGRNFVREFVRNIDETRREVTLIKEQVREFCRYEPRRAPNIYDFSRRDRAVSYGAHNVR